MSAESKLVSDILLTIKRFPEDWLIPSGSPYTEGPHLKHKSGLGICFRNKETCIVEPLRIRLSFWSRVRLKPALIKLRNHLSLKKKTVEKNEDIAKINISEWTSKGAKFIKQL